MSKTTNSMFKCRHRCPMCGGASMNNYKGRPASHFCVTCRWRFWINCEDKEKEKVELTKEEKAAIKRLNALAKVWPKSLWLFAANGELKVMKHTQIGGVDIVANIPIVADGGDW